MAVTFKQYIKIETDNPLEARLSDSGIKAYMVARLAFTNGVEETATHYQISLASVYASMAFYEENRESIELALAKLEALIKEVGIDGTEAIAAFRKRLDQGEA